LASKKLGEVATVESGGTPRRSVARYFDGDIPFGQNRVRTILEK